MNLCVPAHNTKMMAALYKHETQQATAHTPLTEAHAFFLKESSHYTAKAGGRATQAQAELPTV